MSAAEVIEQIKSLPIEEQDLILKFLENSRSQMKHDEHQARHASDSEFQRVAEKVLHEHADLFRRLAQ